MSTPRPTKLRWKASVKYGSELCFTEDCLVVRRDMALLGYERNSGLCRFAREVPGSSSIGYRMTILEGRLLVTWQSFNRPGVMEVCDPSSGEVRVTLEIPGEEYAHQGELVAVITPGTLTLYRLRFAPSPRLEALWEVPCLFDPTAQISPQPLLLEIDPSGAQVAASQGYTAMVWSTQDGSLLWRGEAMLQHLAPWGFFMQRVVGGRLSYESDLFDPYGYLLRTFLDPRCAKNDPDRYNFTYRGYYPRRSSGRYVVFGARWFSRSAGHQETELFLLDRSTGRFEEVKNATSISPLEEEALVGGYGRLWSLDTPTAVRWSVTSEEWERFGLAPGIISRLAPREGRLYGLSSDVVFCLE